MQQARVKLEGLDALRFFAAAAIVLFHLVQMPKLSIPDYLDFIPGRFALGVPLFYLVSAFGLTLGYAGKLASESDVKHYFARRFFRIAPLFYFMMVFYVFFLFTMFGKVVEPSRILTSALFVFNFIPQHATGYVWASWSIGVEMAFYLVLPVLLVSVTSFRRALALFVVSAFLSALWSLAFQGPPPALKHFGGYFILSYLPYFAAGILGYFLWRHLQPLGPAQRRRIGLSFAGIAIVVLVMLLDPSIMAALVDALGPISRKVIFALALMLLTLGLVLAPVGLLVNRLSVGMGKTSYSLYLWHPVIIGLMMRAGAYDRIYFWLVDSAAYAACAILTFALLIPVAALSYRYIEKPGMRLADRFIRNRSWSGAMATSGLDAGLAGRTGRGT